MRVLALRRSAAVLAAHDTGMASHSKEAEPGLFDDEETVSVELDGPQLQTAKAKARAKVKAQSKGKARPHPQPLGPCICPSCDTLKYQGSRFCLKHKRGWDKMVYQKNHDKTVTEEMAEAFRVEMENDATCGAEVEQFCLDVITAVKGMVKVDFAKFMRTRGCRVSASTKDKEKPYTRKSFGKYCENVLGLEEDEIAEYWQECLDDTKNDRDNAGHKGALQLWLRPTPSDM